MADGGGQRGGGDATLRREYESLIKEGNSASPDQIDDLLNKLRLKILRDGLPAESAKERSQNLDRDGPTLRGRIWKILLRIPKVDAERYIGLVERGRSSAYDKIRDDTFRTFKTNTEFRARCPEDKLVRVLNSFTHSCDPASKMTYVQGMNVIAAPFLYVLPEVDAFYCFERFIKFLCPLYVAPALDGVHAGAKMLDDILKLVDKELFDYLASKRLSARLVAFPSIMSFFAATPPLDQVLHLWDMLLAYGIHLNIINIVAQFTLMRDDLLADASPMRLLRNLPPINARAILQRSQKLVRELDDKTYDLLVRHPYDPSVYDVRAGFQAQMSS